MTSARAPTRAADGPDVPAPAPHLRPHAQILSARPRRTDRRTRAAARRRGARNRLRHRAQPDPRGASATRERASTASTFPRKCWRPPASEIARAGLSARIARRAGRRDGVRSASAVRRRGFERVFISYALSMIPPWRERGCARGASSGARRVAAHRRFRRSAGAARRVSRRASRLAGALRRASARDARSAN